MEGADLNEHTAEMESAAPGMGTAADVKSLVQEMLRSGFIESAAETAKFNAVIRHRRDINSILEPLDLRLDIDELRGLAVLCVVECTATTTDEAWSHPLVRRQRLTLEQSLLIAILRQFHVVQEMESGIGVREVRVSLDELLSQLQVFIPDTGSDTKNKGRLITLLEQIKPHGIVTDPDSRGEVVIRPLITRLANPETLTALLQHFRALAQHTASTPDSPPDE